MDTTQKNGIQIGHQTTIESVQSRKSSILEISAKRSFEDFLFGPPQVSSDMINQNRRDNSIRSNQATEIKILKASLIDTAESSGTRGDLLDYTQRKAVSATPTPTTDPRLSLRHPDYGLPDRLVENFAALGINSIYPWQSKCLLANELIHGKGNLVYSAPTGGGKSLVADVIMLKMVIENPEKKAILVLPYVALVQEKLRWLRSAVAGVRKEISLGNKQSMWQRKGDEDSVRVSGFLGGNKSRSSWEDMDIAVCTIEKVRFSISLKRIVLILRRQTHL